MMIIQSEETLFPLYGWPAILKSLFRCVMWYVTSTHEHLSILLINNFSIMFTDWKCLSLTALNLAQFLDQDLNHFQTILSIIVLGRKQQSIGVRAPTNAIYALLLRNIFYCSLPHKLCTIRAVAIILSCSSLHCKEVSKYMYDSFKFVHYLSLWSCIFCLRASMSALLRKMLLQRLALAFLPVNSSSYYWLRLCSSVTFTLACNLGSASDSI